MVSGESRLVGTITFRARRRHPPRFVEEERVIVMRFLLLGGTGQVGKEFRALTLPNDVEVVAPSRGELDLQDPRAITRTIAAQPWSAVINAAAYTDVDRAEGQEPVAFAVNAEA